MEEGYFLLVVHHSGKFFYARYVGGDTSTWSCHNDRWSYFEIVGILKELGFITVHEMWYSRGGCEELENRLEVLVDDGGAIEMLKIVNTHGEVHLFLLHVVSEAEVVLVLGDVEDGGGVEPKGLERDVENGGVEPEGLERDVEDGGGVEPEGLECDVEDGGGVEPEGLERNVEDGGGLQPEDVEGDVEDGGGVEPEGVEGNVEDGGGVESQGVQANVQDGGGRCG